MTITLKNHDTENYEIYTNIDRMTDTPTELILYKSSGFAKKFDKDIYSLQRKDG